MEANSDLHSLHESLGLALRLAAHADLARKGIVQPDGSAHEIARKISNKMACLTVCVQSLLEKI